MQGILDLANWGILIIFFPFGVGTQPYAIHQAPRLGGWGSHYGGYARLSRLLYVIDFSAICVDMGGVVGRVGKVNPGGAMIPSYKSLSCLLRLPTYLCLLGCISCLLYMTMGMITELVDQLSLASIGSGVTSITLPISSLSSCLNSSSLLLSIVATSTLFVAL